MGCHIAPVGTLGDFEEPTAERIAERLQISQSAAELFIESDVIDLHVESYSFYRSFGYHPRKRHTGGLQRALVVGQADLPRLLETGINGATWIITANPLRPPEDRAETFARQVAELSEILEGSTDTNNQNRAAIVRTEAEYFEAKAQGKHACFIGVQGANALPPDPSHLDEHARLLLRITLMHMSDNAWGATSTPSLRPDKGLGETGFAYVERMNELRIGVDLAHIHPRGFWDAVRHHDGSQPLLVTHTGVRGAHDHWRNLDDKQLKAIADTGGTVGLMYHAMYLGDGLFSGRLSTLVRHIQHALAVVGPDHVSLGSDWDGAICTPRDMPTCLELPKLAQALLDEGVTEETIQKILGRNFLRVVRHLKSP